MIEIRVVGPPAAQGNHRASKSGHVYETTKNHKPWRAAVSWAAVEARTKMGLASPALRGPVTVEMVFTLPKPKSAPKRRITWPDRKPDLSKLVRSTEDALSDAGIWEDDARVISCWARKVFPGEDADALDVPGAVIRIERPIA